MKAILKSGSEFMLGIVVLFTASVGIILAINWLTAPGPLPHESVVKVRGKIGKATATHIEIEGKNYFLTNAHVCAGNNKMIIDTGTESEELQVISFSATADLCLIEGSPNYPTLQLADRAIEGEIVRVIGFPMGLKKTTSVGAWIMPNIVSAVIFPGNSGSPVLNSDNEVIGIISVYLPKLHQWGGAVTLNQIRSLLCL